MSSQENGVPAAGNRRQINPFYVLLGLLGTALVVTGVAYGLMMYQTLQPAGAAAEKVAHPLYRLMNEYGNRLLLAELVLLAIFTVAAIKTDNYWIGRNQPAESSDHTARETEHED